MREVSCLQRCRKLNTDLLLLCACGCWCFTQAVGTDVGIWAASSRDDIGERADGSWRSVAGLLFSSLGPVLCTGALCAVTKPLHARQSGQQEGENRVHGKTAWGNGTVLCVSLLLLGCVVALNNNAKCRLLLPVFCLPVGLYVSVLCWAYWWTQWKL